MSDPATNPTSCLLERYSNSGLVPEFSIRKIDSEDHNPLFEASVEVAEGLVALGSGRSKKAARRQAAASMLNLLRNGETKLPPFRENPLKDKGIQRYTLNKQLRSLFTNPKHSDFTVKCQGNSYSCHKAILVSRSPVFDKMISSGSKLLNKVEIKDFKPESVEAVLEYIYTGEIQSEVLDIAELVRAGLQFEIPGLAQVGFNKFNVYFRRGIDGMRKEAMRRLFDNQEGTLQDKVYIDKLHRLQMLIQDLSITEE